MRKVFILSIVLLAVLSLATGCDWMKRMLSESGAEITDFDIAGMVGAPEIDSSNRTVTVTVEPMDLAGVVPTVAVATGAYLPAGVPELKDGQAVDFIVTAENGDETVWKITVNVQYGIAFTCKGTRYVLTKGMIDSYSEAQSVALGNDSPMATYEYGTRTQGYATAETWDYYNGLPNGTTFAAILFPSNSTGDFAEGVSFDYQDATDAFSSYGGMGEGVGLKVTAYGAVGGSITGTFAGIALDSASGSGAYVSEGFFKLLRVQDNAFPVN